MRKFIYSANWATSYLVITIVIHLLYVSLITYITASTYPTFVTLLWTIYALVTGIPIADRFTQMIMFIAIRQPTIPPMLSQLTSQPRVALLYCTCDDAIAECVMRLDSQTYPNVEVFILDDSQTTTYLWMLDQSGYQIIRRPNRSGYKAGNLNHWLLNWGQHFDYFVIVDADSILPPDFVECMLLYAEHPHNQQIALFESRSQIWQPVNELQKAMAIQLRIANESSSRLNNRLETTLSNGHNNLCRTEAIQDVGGFDERFISEDHATALNLIANNWKCKIVDVETYEISPVDLHSMKQRMRRWVRNDLQLLQHSWLNVSLLLQYQLFLHAFLHLLWIPSTLIMFLILWTSSTTWSELIGVLKYLTIYGGYQSPQVFATFLIFTIYILYLIITPLPQVKSCGINLFTYIKSSFTAACVAFGLISPTVQAIINRITNKNFRFEVTPKHRSPDTIYFFIQSNGFLILLVSVVLLGSLNNPVSLVFNWPWLIPLVVSPFVLYQVEKTNIHNRN